ncbi:MAG: 50S ribosomal protein L35 [Candidatus Omnitrophica bacterium]|nr:50S ribosomal protein L35 [Candidatus Omnitrophota bacterium]
MPKLKTNKSIQKRFKVTKNRKVLSSRTKRRHLLGDRSPSKKRQARKRWVMNRVDQKAVLRALPYA